MAAKPGGRWAFGRCLQTLGGLEASVCVTVAGVQALHWAEHWFQKGLRWAVAAEHHSGGGSPWPCPGVRGLLGGQAVAVP